MLTPEREAEIRASDREFYSGEIEPDGMIELELVRSQHELLAEIDRLREERDEQDRHAEEGIAEIGRLLAENAALREAARWREASSGAGAREAEGSGLLSRPASDGRACSNHAPPASGAVVSGGPDSEQGVGRGVTPASAAPDSPGGTVRERARS